MVAAVVAGAWRPSPPPLDLAPGEVDTAVPLLLASGAGSLAFWRLRFCEAAFAAALDALRESYDFYTLLGKVLEQEVSRSIRTLQAAGVEPLLTKGWVVARDYPEAGLRPYRDLDLYVRPQDHRRALAALKGCGPHYPIELKTAIPDLPGASVDELQERSRVLDVRGVPVRVMGREDHFRYLCLHMLRHGVSRPLWLVDIALMLEQLDESFDWERCLAGDPRRSEWVLTAIQLAVELLNCQPRSLPATQPVRLPDWLVPAVLAQWGSPDSDSVPAGAGFLRLLRARWPDPVRATIRMNYPFDARPRLPLQMAQYLRLLGNSALSR